jgi:glycosyltransferase involved in cell wall biosynthesis
MTEKVKTPRVSVIIPCYNTAQYVAEAVGSAFAQTYSDYEVVIVNDDSPDTVELELALTPWWDKIVYVKTENCGLAGARNNGIRAAKGELIALLDSDDIWEPNYLEVQVRKLDENPSADVVYPRTLIFGDGPGSGTRSRASRGEVTFISLIQEACSVCVSVLARREALERVGLFDSSFRSCEDFDMWLRCVKSGSRIIYHDQVLVRYRRRKDSLSSDPVWMRGHAAKVLMKMRDTVQMTPEERDVLEATLRRFEGERLFHEGKRAFEAGDIPTAIDRLQQSNSRWGGVRTRMILFLLRTMPGLTRAAYVWKSRIAKDDAAGHVGSR